jgi:hypothetical protein
MRKEEKGFEMIGKERGSWHKVIVRERGRELENK